MTKRSFPRGKAELLLMAVAVALPAAAVIIHFGLLPAIWR